MLATAGCDGIASPSMAIEPLTFSTESTRLSPAPAQANADRTDASEPDAPAALDGEKIFFGRDGLSFSSLLDIVNPLQHIPVVSAIYRRFIDDPIGPLPRILGGLLFGGPEGAIFGVVNAVIEGATGRDIGGHGVALAENIGTTLVAWLQSEPDAVMVAEAGPWVDPDKLAMGDVAEARPWIDPDNPAPANMVTAKPWIDPDKLAAMDAAEDKPWVNPDLVAAGVASPAKPWVDPDKRRSVWPVFKPDPAAAAPQRPPSVVEPWRNPDSVAGNIETKPSVQPAALAYPGEPSSAQWISTIYRNHSNKPPAPTIDLRR
jgi:hypothetical protein